MQFILERRIGEHLNAHSDCCVFWPGALSTWHAWRAIVALDLYTRNHFSESMGSRFGGPGQKALQVGGFLPNPFIQDMFL